MHSVTESIQHLWRCCVVNGMPEETLASNIHKFALQASLAIQHKADK